MSTVASRSDVLFSAPVVKAICKQVEGEYDFRTLESAITSAFVVMVRRGTTGTAFGDLNLASWFKRDYFPDFLDDAEEYGFIMHRRGTYTVRSRA